MATASALGSEIRAFIDRADEAVVSLDCSGVTFMDSSGYHELVDATDYAARHGHTLVVRRLPSATARVIQLCNRAGELHVESPGRS